MNINEIENNIAFFDDFMKYLNLDKELEDYIKNERNKNCKDLLMSSYTPTNK